MRYGSTFGERLLGLSFARRIWLIDSARDELLSRPYPVWRGPTSRLSTFGMASTGALRCHGSARPDRVRQPSLEQYAMRVSAPPAGRHSTHWVLQLKSPRPMNLL